MTSPDYKIFQVRLPIPIYEAFFRAFPGTGERRFLIERLIEVAIDLAPEKNAFARMVLEEARERYEA